MLHLHFGTGRLGLGLVAPFFTRPGSELYLLNHAAGGTKATGSTALSSARRNELLAGSSRSTYLIRSPGGPAEYAPQGMIEADAEPETVHYDGFATYDDGSVLETVTGILGRSTAQQEGVLVTGSVLAAKNYRPILTVLHALANGRQRGRNGPVFLVACENTLLAQDVVEDETLADAVTASIRGSVTCVAALVDRMCVGLEEDRAGPEPTVVVRAESYGSLKLQAGEDTEELADLLDGSRIEFSRHVETEKQIKSWLLNGSHWLIALAAFSESEGNRDMMLNEYLAARPERLAFAETIMQEVQDGVAAILHSDPSFARFVRDVDPEDYLQGASRAILRRFLETQDPITRILARFQAASPQAPTSIEAFSKRFVDRIGEPLAAYQADRGMLPPASTQSVLSLVKLLANGTFIDARHG